MDFDCIIVGAGPAGCLAARELARAGLSVVLLDKNARGGLGKSVIVEAEKAMFHKVGVALPAGDEVPYHCRAYNVFTDHGQRAFRCHWEHPTVPFELDRLVARLCADAELAGAKLLIEHHALRPIMRSGRVVAVALRHGEVSHEIHARLIIDATGFDAALVRRLDPELAMGFVDDANDVVYAENFLHHVDAAKAAAAVARGLHGDEELRSRLGFAGSYSTEHTHLSLEQGRVYILVGKKAVNPGPSVGETIEAFKKRQGYFGDMITGGGGPIRIRRSLPKLVADGFMALGEAACQVIPIHGSGIASAMYAGWLAARVASRALEGGAAPTTAALWPYASAYQRGRGAVLATYAVTRRTTDLLTRRQVRAMLASGIAQAEDVYHGGVPAPPAISLATVPARLVGLIKHPNLVPPLLRMATLSQAVRRHYRRYPERFCAASLRDWTEKANRLFAQLDR